MLPDGYTDLPPGKLVSVVTYLEITDIQPRQAPSPPAGFTLRRERQVDPNWYRALFRSVGAPWLWFSRLGLSDDELLATLHHPDVEFSVLEAEGLPVGLLELSLRIPEEMELVYLGVTQDFVGVGAGRFLIEHALFRAGELAAARRLRRFWVHTCTLDHPAALGFYQRSGFRPYKRAIEVFDDPRLKGKLPRSCAPHIPLIAPEG